MIIRKADYKDSFAICKISCDDLGYECTKELVSRRLGNLNYNREVVFVAEVDGNIAGYIHAEIYNVLYFESMINVLGLAVTSTYRRHGVGKALLCEVENWARTLGIRKVRLNSGALREDAHAFYKAVGYDNQKLQVRFIKNLE